MINDKQLIGKGRTADVYQVDFEKVLKLFHDGVNKDYIKGEYEISKLVYEKGISVPKVYEMVEMGGRVGIVFEKITGDTLLSHLSKKPWKIRYYAKEMAKLHYNIHQHTIDAVVDNKTMYQNSLNKIKDKYPINENKIIEYIDNLPFGNTICHGDFHPDNIMIENKKMVTIDWSNITKGHPLSDVARTYLLIRTPYKPDDLPKILIPILSLMKRILGHYYLKTYMKLAGIKFKAIKEWFLPVFMVRLIERVPGEEKWLIKTINSLTKEGKDETGKNH